MPRAETSPPQYGFHDELPHPEALLRASRNMVVGDGLSYRRPGYVLRRQMTVPGSATWLERIPLDEADGTLHALLHFDDDIVTDADSPSTVESAVYDPYGATANALPQWVHINGRTIWVGGGKMRCLIPNGSTAKSKDRMADAGTPILASDDIGNSLTAATYYVRVREYDSETGTYSGPSQRTGTAATQTVASGERLQVDITAQNSRSTQWQIEIATTDSPDSYEIVYDPVDSSDLPIGDSLGRIGIGTTTAYIIADPASGAQFEYRTIGAQTLYRHASPPDADFVAHYRGRVFYAARDALWLGWSEADNPEHTYQDPTDGLQGFNNLSGESLIDSVIAPCSGLAANEDVLLFFTTAGIVACEGTWAVLDERRDARTRPLTQGSIGGLEGKYCVVDQEIYFRSQEGPKVYSGGVIPNALDSIAIRREWACRDQLYDHRGGCYYLPQLDIVLFSYVSMNAPITGVPDKCLAWHRGSRRWCPPWDLIHTSMTLHRLTPDGGNTRGVRLMMSLPYGGVAELGLSNGDGWDGSDDDAELESTSDTSTSADVSGKSWTTNEFVNYSLVLVDATTGQLHYRLISSNDGDTLNWSGAAADAGGGWVLAIGGIPCVRMRCLGPSPEELALRQVVAVHDDQLSRRAD